MNFLEQYFIEPIRSGGGYNIANTLAFGVALYLGAILLLKLLKRKKIGMGKISKTVIPFLFLGGVVRSLGDACIYPCNWPLKLFFVTPGIYLTILTVFLLLLFVGNRLKRNIAYPAGWLLLAGNLLLVKIRNLEAIWLTLFFFVIFLLVFIGAAKVLKLKLLLKKFNLTIIGAHLFEASATFVGIDYFGYVEQHVLGGALIGLAGTGAAMIVLKALAIPAVIYLCQGLKGDERVFVKLLVLALGIGPGIRNCLSIAMGV